MTKLDISPRKKIKLDFDFAPEEVIEPPPEACDLCDAMRPKWQFGDSRPNICFECREQSRRSDGWAYVDSWDQARKLINLATVVDHLRKAAYGQSARINSRAAQPGRRDPRSGV